MRVHRLGGYAPLLAGVAARGPGQRLATSAVYWRIRMPPSQHDTRRDAAHRQAPAAQAMSAYVGPRRARK